MSELLGLFAAPLRLVHALVGISFAAGLLGRWVTLKRAERAARDGDLSAVRALLDASSVFERIVVPSSIAVLVLGLFTAWAQGYPVLGPLQGGSSSWLPVSLVLYLSTIPLVPLVFLPKGRAFAAAFDDAALREHTTPELLAAFRDPATRAAHAYEFSVVVAVLVLMISKPF